MILKLLTEVISLLQLPDGDQHIPKGFVMRIKKDICHLVVWIGRAKSFYIEAKILLLSFS